MDIRQIKKTGANKIAVTQWETAAIALIVLLPTVLLLPAIVNRSIPFFMDTVMQFYPWRVHAARMLHGGELPLWNRGIYCGLPFLANPQVGVLYPGNWLFFLFPNPGVFTWLYALHISLCAMGGYFSVRLLTARRGPALLTAIVLLLSGYTLTRLAYGSYLNVWCWTPWMLFIVLKANRRKSSVWCIPLGLLLALGMLGGAPQLAYYQIISLIFLAIILAIANGSDDKGWRGRIFHLQFMALALLIGALVAAPQILTTHAFFAELQQSRKLTLNEVTVGAFDLRAIWHALMGGQLLGQPFEDAESTAYVGGIALLLSLLSLRLWRAKETIALILTFIIATLLCIKPAAPLFYHVLPFYSHFHDPKRAFGVALVFLAILAGMGWTQIEDIILRKKYTGLIGLALAIIALSAAVFWLSDASNPPPLPQAYEAFGWLPGMRFLTVREHNLLFLGLAFFTIIAFIVVQRPRPALFAMGLFLSADLFGFAWQYEDTKMIPAQNLHLDEDYESMANVLGNRRWVVHDSTEIRSGISYSYDYQQPGTLRNLMPNLPLLHELHDFQGYDPAIPRRYYRYLAQINSGYRVLYHRHFGIVRNITSPLLERAGVSVLVGDVDYFHPFFVPQIVESGATLTIPVHSQHRFSKLKIAVTSRQANRFETGDPLLELGFRKRGQIAKILFVIWSDQPDAISQPLVSNNQNAGLFLNVDLKKKQFIQSNSLVIPDPTQEVFEEFEVDLIDIKNDSPYPLRLIGLAVGPSGLDMERWMRQNPERQPALYSLTSSPAFAADSGFARLYSDVLIARNEEHAWNMLRGIEYQPDKAIVEIKNGADIDFHAAEDSPADIEPAGTANTLHQNRISLNVTCPQGRHLLVLHESYFKGWKAYVDNEEVPIYPADGMFMGIVLDGGAHKVEFRYRPVRFSAGIIISSITLAGLLIYGIHFRYFSRRTETASERSGP